MAVVREIEPLFLSLVSPCPLSSGEVKPLHQENLLTAGGWPGMGVPHRAEVRVALTALPGDALCLGLRPGGKKPRRKLRKLQRKPHRKS